MTTETRRTSIGAAIDGARGTIVFGNGVPALTGDISHTGDDDYVTVTGTVSGTFNTPHDYAIPLAAIVYVRYDEVGS